VSLIETVEPLLRRVAAHEIDTSGRLEDALCAILALAGADVCIAVDGPPARPRGLGE
jgi:hypothetical protein